MIGSGTARRIAVGVATLALVANTGALATAAPVRCGARAGRQPVELCRVTVLKGTTAGYVRVHLSGTSPLTADVVDVSGNGSFSGFVLVEDVPKFDGTTILGGRASSGPEAHEFVCCSFQAPPGTYRLYLLTESAPAKVTLRLADQPEGTSTLSPRYATGFELGDLTASSVGDKAPEYYAAGSTGTISASRGLSFAGLWVDSAAHALEQSGRCFYFDEVPADAFAPGCPYGADRVWSQGGVVAPSVTPVTSGIYGMTYPLPRGTYSHGIYTATAGVAEGSLSVIGWLDFD